MTTRTIYLAILLAALCGSVAFASGIIYHLVGTRLRVRGVGTSLGLAAIVFAGLAVWRDGVVQECLATVSISLLSLFVLEISLRVARRISGMQVFYRPAPTQTPVDEGDAEEGPGQESQQDATLGRVTTQILNDVLIDHLGLIFREVENRLRASGDKEAQTFVDTGLVREATAGALVLHALTLFKCITGRPCTVAPDMAVVLSAQEDMNTKRDGLN